MEELSGYVDHIVYKNNENNYTVLILISGEKEICCVGYLQAVGNGETLEMTGEYVEHPMYGRQYKIATYHTVLPKDIVSIERYLGSGAIKGIGPTLATRIVNRFQEDTFRVLEEEPELLIQIKGISERMAREIAVSMEEKKDLREAMIFLAQYGISNALAVKIYQTYNDELYRVLRENPYKLAEDVSGVGFKIADEIAAKIGIRPDSDYRIRCGILYTLKLSQTEGHSYLPTEELKQRTAKLLEVDEQYIALQLANLMMDKKIVIREEAVFSTNYFYAELNCARMLKELNIPMPEATQSAAMERAMHSRLDQLKEQMDMELDELQMRAVTDCIKNGLFILSGGPGTGKTTTIDFIIRYFETEGKHILLGAPTGRAAKRMTEATGFEAKTLHRLLEINSAISDDEKRTLSFDRNRENPLEADVIIVDEMSMVDLLLFQALLKAITPGTRLILVGDVDQLPSVGAGQVLRDLMNSNCFPQVSLQRIFRQAAESDIIQNAHKINHGQQIALDNKSKDFFFLERDNIQAIYKHMVLLITGKLPAYVGATPLDVQVLTPARRGATGCETLNPILQKHLNPASPNKKEHLYGNTLFREGDKVMQIKNNYQLEWEIVSKYHIPIDSGCGVFNGDIGKIKEINESAAQLVVEFDEQRLVTYPFSLLEELELSYAITIHKSQGSEYPAVILPLTKGSKQLYNRNLLYTAVTRAKHCVMIIGESKCVYDMIENAAENNRYSALAARIREICQ